MNADPVDTEEARFGAEAHLRYGGGGDDLAENVLALLDENAALRARIEAVEEALDGWDGIQPPAFHQLADEIRRALDGDA